MSQVVLVTGFGPFRDHNINASWEAVKLLPNQIDEFEIRKQEIPVAYDHVQKTIPKLWSELNPVLVIHVGVSSHTDKLVLEKSANRNGYVQKDVLGQSHSSGCVCSYGEDCITTDIDVDDICDVINNSNEMKATTSTNAGRYLCEFIYYTSLHIDKTKTIFIHVPPIDKPYSAQELSNGLLEVMKGILNLMKNKQGIIYKDTGKCQCFLST